MQIFILEVVCVDYSNLSIEEVLKKIGDNEIYLPAIQRRFVWDTWQIEGLFDSIMRNYPIGTFIFWKVDKKRASNYVFYRFLQNYHERDRFTNDRAPQPELKENILGVLDGQQRLSSMYVSLQGTYAIKKPYARWDDDEAFPPRELYINLFKNDILDEVETEQEDGSEKISMLYEFKLLTEEEAYLTNDKKYWFPVRQVLEWGTDPKIDEYYDSVMESEKVESKVKEWMKEKRDLAKRIMRKLHQRLVIQRLISYYEVDEPDLDNVLEIFIRVNSYGKPLTKTDLLLATIASIWDNGRDEIEGFLKSLNKRGDGFFFDNDFIMRASLVLTDSPVLFKVKGFPEKNIEKIKSQWSEIKSALEETVDLLTDLGFNSENLTSQNAIIPIAYFAKNGGDLRASKDEFRRYMVHSMLRQIYSGQGDSTLSKMREALKGMRKLSTKFTFDKLLSTELPNKKTLRVTDEDISSVLAETKGPLTFAVLSLLYPNLKYGQVKFHQDHMHPAALFTESKLRSQGIPPEFWGKYEEKTNTLPNLQIMEGTENEEKNKTPLASWVNGNDRSGRPNVSDFNKYLADNYVPNGVSLDFKNFLTFYDKRRDFLKTELTRLLK